MLRRRNLLALAGTAVAIVAAAGTIAAQHSAREQEPGATTTAQSTSTATPQGDPPEQHTRAIPVPEASRLAGPPTATARRFVSVWLDRGASAEELRRQRPVLVGLATGSFAQLIQVTIDDALATGDYGPENDGTVEFAKLEEQKPSEASVLLVCRERPQGGPWTYTIYLATLVPISPGRYALSDLQPQG